LNSLKSLFRVDSKIQPDSFLYDLGVLLFLIPVCLFVISTLFLAVGFNINPFVFPLSVVTSLGFIILYRNNRKNQIRHFFYLGILLFALLILLLYLNNFFFDISFDGQWYHQDAIILLKEGWNPFYDDLIHDSMVSGLNADYVNHYAKAPWFSAAAIYSFTGKIQLAKSVNGILLLSSFFITFSFLKRYVNIGSLLSLVISGLFAFSPLSFGQLHSFCVDGQLSSVLLIAGILALEHIITLQDKKLVLLSLILIYFINIKFTGLIYGIILLSVILSWIFIRYRKEFKKIFVIYSIVTLAGTFLLGYPTYSRNIIEKHHPFYPVLGPDNIGQDLVQVSYAKNFFSKNRFEKFFLSTFATPQYSSADRYPAVPKRLFNIQTIKYGFAYFKNHQPMILSPIGPVYGEFVLLFLPYSLLIIYLCRRKPEFLFLAGGCTLSIILFPEFWIYRYTPQLYFLYILFFVIGLKLTNRLLRYYGLMLIVVLCINTLLNNWFSFVYNYEQSKEIKNELAGLSNSKIIVRRGWIKSFEYRLKENKINYTIEETVDSSLIFVSFKADYFSKWTYHIDNNL